MDPNLVIQKYSEELARMTHRAMMAEAQVELLQSRDVSSEEVEAQDVD